MQVNGCEPSLRNVGHKIQKQPINIQKKKIDVVIFYDNFTP